MIGRFRRKSSAFVLSRAALAVLVALAVAAVVAGCGGDDEGETGGAATTPTATVTAPATESVPEAETETEQAETQPAEVPEPETETAESPEDQPGGAGDEEPARTLALFTGRAGRITPRVVRVPAFISIRVELRSADGASYGLDFGEVAIKAGGAINSRARTLDGLRPQERIVGRPIVGAGKGVRIEATAEPGP